MAYERKEMIATFKDGSTKTYESGAEAARDLGVSRELVRLYASRMNRKTRAGISFTYGEIILSKSAKEKLQANLPAIRVRNLSTSEELEFTSLRQASLAIDKEQSYISQAIRNGQMSNSKFGWTVL